MIGKIVKLDYAGELFHHFGENKREVKKACRSKAVFSLIIAMLFIISRYFEKY